MRTYIQSGNVLFSAPTASNADLVGRIERMLGKAFDHYAASVVLRSQGQMRKVVDEAPDGFGSRPDKYRYEAIFLKAPLTSKTAIKEVEMKEGVDQCWAGNGVLYF